ncbi:MAG: hypothetical protein V3W00_01630, partial [Candidatus Brocadiales bacterium]
VTYVTCAPKSNAAYLAVERALDDVRRERTMAVPKHLRDASYQGAARLGHGKGYKYPHNYEGQWVEQEYTPRRRRYYEPKEVGRESEIKARLEKWRKGAGKGDGPVDTDRESAKDAAK